MDSLLDFITFTKGVEYLIAVGFLIAFIAFWQLVYGKGKRRGLRIAVLSYMVIAFIILVVSCVNTAPQ